MHIVLPHEYVPFKSVKAIYFDVPVTFSVLLWEALRNYTYTNHEFNRDAQPCIDTQKQAYANTCVHTTLTRTYTCRRKTFIRAHTLHIHVNTCTKIHLKGLLVPGQRSWLPGWFVSKPSVTIWASTGISPSVQHLKTHTLSLEPVPCYSKMGTLYVCVFVSSVCIQCLFLVPKHMLTPCSSMLCLCVVKTLILHPLDCNFEA